MKNLAAFFSSLKKSTPEQARDTGMAMVLILLLIVYFGNRAQWLPAAIVVLVLCMTWPRIFRPLAGVWFGLSHLLGTVVSKIVLSILFFGLVLPIGLIRRGLGADPLQLKRWKANDGSVFKIREAQITAKELENPY
jgi:hypothetical protein